MPDGCRAVQPLIELLLKGRESFAKSELGVIAAVDHAHDCHTCFQRLDQVDGFLHHAENLAKARDFLIDPDLLGQRTHALAAGSSQTKALTTAVQSLAALDQGLLPDMVAPLLRQSLEELKLTNAVTLLDAELAAQNGRR